MSTEMSAERDELPDPPTPHHQLHGPSIDVRAVLLGDAIPPAETLLQRSGFVPKNEPLPFSRYVSQEFHDLEMSRMWGRVWQYVTWTYDISKPGDVFVDVGANLGYYSLIAARAGTSHVYAFEAQPSTYELLGKKGN